MAAKERADDNQKLKMLYLVKIFSDQTDDTHGLTLQEIAARLEENGVNADRNGTDWRRQTVRVRAGEKIRVSLAPGGGWVARIARAGSCPRPASR